MKVTESQVGSVLNPSRRPPESYGYLPLFAKLAVERLDRDNNLRSGAVVDELMRAYAQHYGLTPTTLGHDHWEFIRFSVHYRCAKRFADFTPA